jgi:AmmeMemoRadiSam system protein B
MTRGDTGTIGPTVAGTWYPGEEEALRGRLQEWLGPAGPPKSADGPTVMPEVQGLVVPHAGFDYSGQVAAFGFGRLRSARFERVILLGPSHYFAFEGAAVPTAGRYRTPLGDVQIDVEAIASLHGTHGIVEDDEPFRPEHSLDAEIPFLQYRLGELPPILPVLLGGGTGVSVLSKVAAGLGPLATPETLLVASSDFTHYGSRFQYVPFRTDVPNRIEQLDRGAIELILERDLEGFAGYVARTGATICGRAAIDILLRLLPGEPRGVLEAYDTSGRMTDDWENSVSYASLVFEHVRKRQPA